MMASSDASAIENGPFPVRQRRARERTWPLPPNNAAEARYLELSSGRRDCTSGPMLQAGRIHLIHLKSLTDDKWTEEFGAELHEKFRPNDESPTKVIWLCCEVLALFREDASIGIHQLIRRLKSSHILRQRPDSDQAENPTSAHLVFSVIGWISLLYIPESDLGMENLCIAPQSTASASQTAIPMRKAARPIYELLRAFGELLPKHAGPSQRATSKFKVSSLNIAAMKTLASVEIIWVDSISAHLEFDPTKRRLSVFKCPSFCELQRSDQSILTILLQRFYVDDEKPCKTFSVPNLMAEILRSYEILFKEERSARRMYQTRERRNAALTETDMVPVVDPCLDERCGKALSSSVLSFGNPVRDLYDAEADFPILKGRLQRIQDYMEGIEPNRFVSLWRDRRDLRLWYTIWTVIILGLIGVIEATISLGLSAVQLYYSFKSYEQQLEHLQR